MAFMQIGSISRRQVLKKRWEKAAALAAIEQKERDKELQAISSCYFDTKRRVSFELNFKILNQRVYKFQI